MPRFFCESVSGDNIILTGEDAQHIGKALRMKDGETVTVACQDGMDYDCAVSQITSDQVILSILKAYPNESEPSLKLTLYQAMPKSDKMDFIIQKAVELGVTRIVPMLTKRCVSRPDEKSMKKKMDRFQKIAKEAAKQSGRGIIPEIGELLSFEQAVLEAAQSQISLLCYEKGGKRLNHFLSTNTESAALMIGSEGGFEESEALFAKSHGVESATLGKLILRCETAPLAAISVMMNLTENI